MKVESVICVLFTYEEVKNALVCIMEGGLNELVVGSDEFVHKEAIINHIKNSDVNLDLERDGLCMSVDGVAQVEDF